jgi:hypothetical protein
MGGGKLDLCFDLEELFVCNFLFVSLEAFALAGSKGAKLH